MSIPVRCKNCNRGHRAPDSLAGQTFKCKRCAEPVTVPNRPPLAADARTDSNDQRDDEFQHLETDYSLDTAATPSLAHRAPNTSKPEPGTQLPDPRLAPSLEERVLQRAEGQGKRGTVPHQTIAAGGLLSLIGTVLLLVGLGSRGSAEASSFSLGGVILLVGGFIVLIMAGSQWIANLKSRD